MKNRGQRLQVDLIISDLEVLRISLQQCRYRGLKTIRVIVLYCWITIFTTIIGYWILLDQHVCIYVLDQRIRITNADYHCCSLFPGTSQR